MSVTPILDYPEVVLPALVSQYQNSPKFVELLRRMALRGQDVETALHEIRDLFWDDTAEGVQLDAIGYCVGEERLGRSDAPYLSAIALKKKNLTSGTWEDVIRLTKELTGANQVLIIPAYPAGYFVLPSTGAELLTQAFLDRISPAGVRGLLPCYLAMESPPSGDPDEALLFEDGDWILIEGPCTSQTLSGWGVGWGESWGD